jgi:hypothetical protein
VKGIRGLVRDVSKNKGPVEINDLSTGESEDFDEDIIRC